jgi:hypothetical protein
MANESIPTDILEEIMEARQEWSRHQYPICPRAMLAIDLALDRLIDYHATLDQYEEVFSG